MQTSLSSNADRRQHQ